VGRTERWVREQRREILRASRFVHADAYTFSDPNRDSYANSDSNCNSYANIHTWTAPAKGPAEKGWGNKHGASQLEGGDLA